eukprot:m.134972 g.134972  ORF g.134972 m.134972 type:complete len:898 (-) comp13970_c0_seq1:215-2908(-)
MDATSSPPPSSSPPPATTSDDGDMEPFPDETEDLQRDERIPMADDEEEEEGEDLFGDDMTRDYRAIETLDRYDPEMLDEGEQRELSRGERQRIERMMAKRDQRQMRIRGRTRLPGGLGFGDDDLSESEGEPREPIRKRRLLAAQSAQKDADEDGMEGDEDEMDENEPIIENLENFKGNTLREWISMEPTRREIFRRFKIFLRTTKDERGQLIYSQRIRDMCERNAESLIVSYVDLSHIEPTLAIFVADAPSETIEIFDAAAKAVVLEHFPNYDNICAEIHVRIAQLAVRDRIRDLRQSHLNALVCVDGVVTRRTGVFPQLKVVKFNCDKCDFVIGPIVQDTIIETTVHNCPNCQSKGPFSINTEETVYRNYQRITIQESPGSVPAGRLPRQKDVIVLWDYVDYVKPGDEISLTGIYRNNFDRSLNTKHGFPVFATVIEANYIEKKSDKLGSDDLSDDDVKMILQLGADENIGQKIIQSIAPSIYGHEDIKTALALSMFGGVPKNPQEKHRVRGDINVLVLGDPGTAKSQFLKYVEKTAHRAVFTTGQGASAVGLTASVSMDAVTREWTLQGGALVLADQGVCLIDEFDKMNDQDRTSIHEAMEQQSISLAKAGIVTSLQARCAVIAAANPIKGRYQASKTFAQNVDLTEPILSRFDILCVVKDVVDPVIDERLASFVVDSHTRSHPDFSSGELGEAVSGEGPLTQDVLRKYMRYAKKHVQPQLNKVDKEKIAQLYAQLRQESQRTGSVPITVRYIESMIRIAEAHARMHLRKEVRSDDVNMAIRVVLTSFIETQKHSVMRTMKRTFQKFITYKKDNNELLLFVLRQLLNETMQFYQVTHSSADDLPPSIDLHLDEFLARARQLEIHDLTDFFASDQFLSNGFTVNTQQNTITRSFVQ